MAVKGNATGKGWDGIGTNMGNEKVDERNVHFCFALLSMCIHAMPMYLLNCDWLKEIVMWGSCVPYLSRSASILFLVSWVCFYFIRCWKSPFLCFLCPWPLPGVKDLIVSQTSRVFYLTSSIKRIYIRSWWRRVLPAKLPTRGMRVPDRAQWLAQRWERFPVFHSIVIL